MVHTVVVAYDVHERVHGCAERVARGVSEREEGEGERGRKSEAMRESALAFSETPTTGSLSC